MAKDYAPTYDAADVRAHYGFFDSFGLPEVLAAYHRVGRDMIRSAAVIEHLGVLSRYVAAVRGRTLPALH